MKRRVVSFALILFVAFLAGCYLPGAEYSEDLDLVYTNYDKNYNFDSKLTYSIPSKITKIDGDPTSAEYVKDIYAIPMLAQIEANMTKLGWTKVPLSSNPDLQLLPGAWTTTTVVGSYWGNYYCWYYYYYCGGGWYYPYPVYSSYSTGTMVMTLVDPNKEGADETKQVVWSGAINGILSSSYDVDRINVAIDQAFKQSQYLKTN